MNNPVYAIAKQACEATLPRNISCEIVITAVPKTGDK